MTAQAEAAVLGAALASDRAADVACDLLHPADVATDAHRLILEAIRATRLAGMTADLPTVTEALHQDGRLDEAGGTTGVYDLLAAAPPGKVEQWCHQIRNGARRRRLESTIEQLRAEVQDCTDVDALIEDAVEQLAANATGGGQIDRGTLLEAFARRVDTGSPLAGWRFPWQQLDFFRLPDDGLTVWTGLPGSGKSTLVDVTVVELLQKNPHLKVAFFSPEMAPADNHLHEMVRTAMGRDPRADRDAARRWAEHLTGRCFWIDDDRDSTPSAVLAAARRMVRDQGVRMLVIDPYNNLEPDRQEQRDRQDLYIQALLRKLRRFARAYGVAVIVVAHPRRTEKVHGTDAVYRIPTAGDISGGQEWWNHADAIVSVWRNQSGEETPKYGRPQDVKVVVSKCRFAKWGSTGKGELEFGINARSYR